MEDPTSTNEDLFSVFVVAILTVIAVPWTVSKVTSEAKEEVSLNVARGRKEKKKGFFGSRSNVVLTLLWLAILSLSIYIAYSSEEDQKFDPFEILELPTSATKKQIKSAYRKLSLKYHPDKNPDPAASEFFSNFVSKAYKTLTDETARENWEKYGHPDGPSSTKFGVALPTFLFRDNEKASIILLGLIVALAIIIPVAYAIFYLNKSKKYANNVMVETLGIWLNQQQSPVHIKQAHSIHRVIETLTCAAEFVEIKVARKHYPLLEQLMKNLIRFKALKEGDKMFKKKVELIRSHFAVLAWTYRIDIPKELKQEQILKVIPKLAGELVKAAAIPRIARHNYCWFAPTQAVIETMQCIFQAVPTDVKRPRTQSVTSNSSKALQGKSGLYQLPHVDEHVMKMMAKGTPGGIKVKTLDEMLKLSDSDLKSLLEFALDRDLGERGVNETFTMVRALPRVEVTSCKMYVEQEEGIVVFDPTLVELNVMLKRDSHKSDIVQQMKNLSAASRSKYDSLVEEFVSKAGSEDKVTNEKMVDEVLDTLEEIFNIPKTKGQQMMAETPLLPFKKAERWYFLVGDVKANLLYCYGNVEMDEAEECGFRDTLLEEFSKSCHAKVDAMKTGDYDYANIKKMLPGKLSDLRSKSGCRRVILGFRAPPPGDYDVSIMILSDAYLGCDVFLQRKITVDSKARAAGAKEENPEKSHEKQKRAKLRAEKAAAKAAARLNSIDSDDEVDSNISSATQLDLESSDDDVPPLESDDEAEFSSDEESSAANQQAAVEEDDMDSDFSYDSQDTGTDIDEEFEALEMKHWTVQPVEDRPPPPRRSAKKKNCNSTCC